MDKFLSDSKINYVLFHLEMVLNITEEIRACFTYHKDPVIPDTTGRILFLLSDKSINLGDIEFKDDLAVLFPVLSAEGFYHLENKNLIFHDDILKSCFYLLSAYQEISPENLDSLGRFPHSSSIQHQLNFTTKPLVNYLFEIIKNGIKEFAKVNKLEYREKKVFKDFSFFLSHDVDRVDTYTAYELGFAIKQLLGVSKSDKSARENLQNVFKYFFNYMNLFSRKNPHWDFSFHRELEKNLGIKSTYYFLPKGILHHDAYYSFKEKRILELVRTLRDDGSEVALHGSVRTSKDAEFMKNDYNYFSKYMLDSPKGIRQHRLLFDTQITPSIQNSLGFKYDTSLGFAEHEGFRNSFCLPFRLFDHVNDTMLNIWEIPLVAMDVTLFSYRKYTIEEATKSIHELIEEAKKFSGIFSLLWHNGNFDDTFYPGVKKFYTNLLEQISEMKMESLTGEEIISRIE